MHIGVLGTGIAGRTLAQALVDHGHEVRMGSRAAGNEKAVAWAEASGPLASEGSFADAAAFGELNCDVMVKPSIVPGSHTIFICGDDDDAKAQARILLDEFGWPASSILDLGDISGARAMEMYLPLWVRLYGAMGTAVLNIEVRAG
jgi:predicted dinucleotide-binding enzyme